MTEEQQRQILLAAVQSMVIELDDRLGGANPWKLVDFSTWSAQDLAGVKRLLHEPLYAPPTNRP